MTALESICEHFERLGKMSHSSLRHATVRIVRGLNGCQHCWHFPTVVRVFSLCGLAAVVIDANFTLVEIAVERDHFDVVIVLTEPPKPKSDPAAVKPPPVARRSVDGSKI